MMEGNIFSEHIKREIHRLVSSQVQSQLTLCIFFTIVMTGRAACRESENYVPS